jgi:hypothetical protein
LFEYIVSLLLLWMQRFRVQLQIQKENEKRAQAEHEAKIKALEGKVNIDVSFDFTDADRDSALRKLTVAAAKYDRCHPAAMALDGFNSAEMEAPQFKEMVRRTFGLKLTPAEAGALVRHFSKTPLGITVDCPEFIVMFIQLGNAERTEAHKAQLDRQRMENKAREDEEKRKLNALQGRHEIRIDAGYSAEDKASAMDKLLAASVAYDKNHPAAPSLSAFECKVRMYSEFAVERLLWLVTSRMCVYAGNDARYIPRMHEASIRNAVDSRRSGLLGHIVRYHAHEPHHLSGVPQSIHHDGCAEEIRTAHRVSAEGASFPQGKESSGGTTPASTGRPV